MQLVSTVNVELNILNLKKSVWGEGVKAENQISIQVTAKKAKSQL